jgi:beta-N-acetylhexosaminidase
MQDLLRGQLGFNGLIVTDATTMCGFAIPMPRPEAVPLSIERGADICLVTRNLEEDFTFMEEGLRSGLLSEKRLNDAVTRLLAMQAALGLHLDRRMVSLEKANKVVGCKEHRDWAMDCAKKTITLVKEQDGVLPITPEKYKRVLFCPIESEKGVVYTVREGVCATFQKLLEAEGFDVEEFVPLPNLEGNLQPYSDFRKYDLILYMANISTKSNQTTVRIEWKQPMGANAPIYVETVPTVFISVENPYHLLDVPRVKTFINTYSSHNEVLEALIDKLTGRAGFRGTSPVDAFCGRWDTRL